MVDIRQAINLERKSKTYARYYFEAEEEMKGLFRLDTRILRHHIKGGKIFDPMMGPGRHVVYFAKKGHDVWGNDFNKHMVDQTRRALKKNKTTAKLTNYDVCKLARIKDNTFDHIIVMFNSLGSIYKKDRRQLALKEFSRVLKPGGHLYIHCHNIAGFMGNSENMWLLKETLFNRPSNLEFGDVIDDDDYLEGLSYQHLFTPWEVSNQLKKARLKVKKKIYLSGYKQNKIERSIFREFVSDGFILIAKKSL